MSNKELGFLEERQRKFKNVSNTISFLQKQLKTIKNKKKNAYISSLIPYVRSFQTKGVQGIAGLLSCKHIDPTIKETFPVVFKISANIGKSVEHEDLILQQLNTTSDYFPHFMKSFGTIETNVPFEFFENNFPTETTFSPSSSSEDDEEEEQNDEEENDKKVSLFSSTDEKTPSTILLAECVERIPFYRLTKYCSDKNIIVSQILQVLFALQVGQHLFKFTHYDLHLGNVLEQQCEKNSVFLYHLENEWYTIPTFGFYPVLIDMGISHSNSSENRPMFSNTDSYYNGFQTTLFDPLFDVHHFLLSLFYPMEDENSTYDYLSNKISHIFRHLPVLRKSGWKELPCHVSRSIISKIKNDCKNYKTFPIFCSLDSEFLETINPLIILPIKKYENRENFSSCFEEFCKQIDKLFLLEELQTDQIVFGILEIAMVVNEFRNQTMTSKVLSKFQNRVKERLSIIDGYVDTDIDYSKLFSSAIKLGETLSTNYSYFISKNTSIIEKTYAKTAIKSPLDMFLFIQAHATPPFYVNHETMIRVWDIDKKTSYTKSCSHISDEMLKKINKSSWRKKGELLSQIE